MSYTPWSVVFQEQPTAAKWNQLGDNDASFHDGTGIENGAIPPDRLVGDSGASWVYQDYDSNPSNLSGGTLVSRYCQIGKLIHFYWSYAFTGAGVAGNVTFDLPLDARDNSNNLLFGNAYFTGTNNIFGTVIFSSNSTGTVYANNTASTYQTLAALSSTVPFTWANGHKMYVNGIYETA